MASTPGTAATKKYAGSDQLQVRDFPAEAGHEESMLVINGCAGKHFQQYLIDTDSVEVAGLMSTITKYLDDERGLTDYRFKIKDARYAAGWEAVVFYGGSNDERTGPLRVERCMSCEMDCPLSVGLTGKDDGGPTSRDTLLFTENESINCWLDAKARPVLILTPNRHVRRLGDLDANEMADLWSAVGKVMREWGVQRYKSIVVNHGNAQNHAHMHLKVWVTQEEFDRQLYSRSDLAATVGMLQAWVSTLPIEAQGRWRQQNSMGGRRGGRRGRGGYPSSQHGRDRGQHSSKMQRRS